MFRRSFLVPFLVLPALAACGNGSSTAPSGGTAARTDEAALLVTRDCGKQILIALTDTEAGQTAMRALDKAAELETDSGGKFVTAINGIEQNTGKKLAWLYYINGKPAQKGATEVELAPGDVEWWDLHNYEQECAVVPPAAQ